MTQQGAVDGLENKLDGLVKKGNLVGDGTGNGSKVSVEGNYGNAEIGYKGVFMILN